MRPLFFLFCSVMLVLPAAAQSLRDTLLSDPIAYFASGFADDSPEEFDKRVLVRIALDFNNDGSMDFALSETHGWGNAGGNWEIYLARTNGKFQFIDSVFFHPLAFRVEPLSPGMSRLVIYRRMNASEGDLIEYGVSREAVKEIGSRLLKSGEKDKKGHREYFRLFGHLLKNPVSEYIPLQAYLKNPKLPWHSGY